MVSNNQGMSAVEKKTVFSLASIYFVRMFGLFLLFPIIVVYAQNLTDSTIALAGVSLGIYGLTQAIFQIPLGYLSDRFGRKKIIAMGLVIFALGSIVAALSDSIYGLIAGRAIQGMGAISAAVLALSADLIPAKQRAKAMALIGISIGAAFMLSLVLAPLLQHWIGARGLFWLVFVLAISALLILRTISDSPVSRQSTSNEQSHRQRLKQVLDQNLMQLCMSVFTLHLLLAVLFVILPTMLIDNLHIPLADHWKFYFGILVASAIGMLPFVRANTQQHQSRTSFNLAIALLWVALLVFKFAFSQSSLVLTVVAGILFFSAFNALESILPSLVSRIVASDLRGTALGIYNTHQFLGIFIGGILAGWLWQHYGMALIWSLLLGICVLWLGLSLLMKPLVLHE